MTLRADKIATKNRKKLSQNQNKNTDLKKKKNQKGKRSLLAPCDLEENNKLFLQLEEHQQEVPRIISITHRTNIHLFYLANVQFSEMSPEKKFENTPVDFSPPLIKL